MRRMDSQVPDASAADWLLDRLPDGGDVISRPPGMNDEVNVFRHEDVGQQGELQFLASLGERVGQPLASSLRLQKGIVAKTRKRQLVSMARLIDRRPAHGAKTPIQFAPPLLRRDYARDGRGFAKTQPRPHICATGAAGSTFPRRRSAWPGVSLRSPGVPARRFVPPFVEDSRRFAKPQPRPHSNVARTRRGKRCAFCRERPVCRLHRLFLLHVILRNLAAAASGISRRNFLPTAHIRQS